MASTPRRRYFNNKLLHPVLVYRTCYSCITVASGREAARFSLSLSLLLSRRCSGDLHEIGDPSANRPVDLSLEWKSRIEIFSSASGFVRVSCAVLSRLPRSIPIRVAFLSTRPKNIGFAPPPASEISANLMRRTGISPTLPITPLIRFYLSASERISGRRAWPNFSRSFSFSSSASQPNLISRGIFHGDRNSKANILYI